MLNEWHDLFEFCLLCWVAGLGTAVRVSFSGRASPGEYSAPGCDAARFVCCSFTAIAASAKKPFKHLPVSSYPEP